MKKIKLAFFSSLLLLIGQLVQAQSDYFATLTQKEYFQTSYFGMQGFQILDLDNDGQLEIIAAVNQKPSYFAIYTYTGSEYKTKWASKIYLNGIQGLCVGKKNNTDANYTIFVLNNLDKVEEYDAVTYALKTTYTLNFGEVRDLTIDNVDNTASNELVTIGQYGFRVYNLTTHQTVWSSNNIIGDQLKIADLDNDNKKEIIIAPLSWVAGGGITVLDAYTNSTKWSNNTYNLKNIQIYDINKDGFNDIVGSSSSEIAYIDSKTKEPKLILRAFNDFRRGFYVGDTDRDGEAEIITMASAGSMYCYSMTGVPKWYYRTNDGFTTAIFVTDIDRDGKAEIIRGSEDHLFINDYETQAQEYGSISRNGLPTLALGDFNNDKQLDLLLSNTYKHSLSGFSNQYPKSYFKNYNLNNLSIAKSTLLPFNGIDNLILKEVGKSRSKTKTEIALDYGIYDALTHERLFDPDTAIFGSGSIYSFTPLKFTDLDGDGIDEILASDTKKFEVYKWNGTKYNVVYDFPVDIGGQMYCAAVGNIDRDTALEVIGVDYFGKVSVYDAQTHQLQWKSENIKASCVQIVDLDMDNKLEILIGTDDGYLIVLDAETKAEKNRSYISGSRVYHILIENLDLTLSPEIVIIQYNQIRIFSSSLATYWDMPDEYDNSIVTNLSIVFADADNDQYKEMYFANGLGLFIFKLNSKYQNPTNIANSIVENSWLCYPNPSAGLIEISLSEPVEGFLEISNILGQPLFNKKVSITDKYVTLDLSNYIDGFYTATLNTSRGISVKKFLLSK